MPNRKSVFAGLTLALIVLAVFWRAVVGGVFFFGDIFALHYPLHAAYETELSRLSLPLWTTDVLAGYPLLAEGQLGALYPPNWLLHTLFATPRALTLFVIGHLILKNLRVT